MKKFKFLSMTFVAAAFVGCTNDEFDAANNYKLADDGSEVFATIADPSEGSMRAGFATTVVDDFAKISQKVYFTKGDVFKMYCTDTWMPQVYQFTKQAAIDDVNNGAVFTWAYAEGENGAEYNKPGEDLLKGREYGVYPADNFEFRDEKRSVLYYTVPKKVTEFGAEAAETGLKDKNGAAETRTLYKSFVPMFGFCEGDKIVFHHMTGFLRVDMYSMNVGHPYRLKLSSTKYKLSGTFASTEFKAYEGVDAKLPVFAATTTTTSDEKEIWLEFTPTKPDAVVYMPIPAGKYELSDLTLVYDIDATASWQNLEMYTPEKYTEGEKKGEYIPTKDSKYAGTSYTVPVGLALVAQNVKAIVGGVVNDWQELNAKLVEYAKFTRDVEVDLTLGGTFDISEVTTDYIEVPELKNNVTLNIKAGTGSYNSMGTSGKVLNIQDKDNLGAGTLTINSNVALNSKINSTTKQNITLNCETEFKQGAEFTAGTAKVGIAGNINTQPIVIKSAGEVNVGKTAGNGIGKMVVECATDVNIAKDGSVQTLDIDKEGCDVVVDGQIYTVLNANKNVDVAVNNEASVASIVVAADATATVETFGTAVIKSVTLTEKVAGKTNADGVCNITANWDADTQAALDDEDYDRTTYAQDNIYTAIQLATLQDQTLASDVTLYADVLIDEEAEAEWTPAVLGSTATFVGNGHTIDGINIAGTKDDSSDLGFFSTFRGKVNGLTLKNLVITVHKDAKAANAKNIGALAGKMDSYATNAEVADVVIEKAKINGTKATSNVGGLIGYAEGKITVENTTIEAAIKGYYNLGGVIGGTAANVDITLGSGYGEDKAEDQKPVKVNTSSIEVIMDTEGKEYDNNAGKVAWAVGELADQGVLSLGYFDSKTTTGDWKYEYCVEKINNVMMSFDGCKNGSDARYYVGYSPEAATVTVINKELAKFYDGTGKTEAKTTNSSYNIFSQKQKD